ncbi:hypothetical protein FOA52_012168 [Chlamydomonas sp. UWO 241]|nr:hypothetical protein FOA52_012168 [Chlamydomonas sp. UWO 241]
MGPEDAMGPDDAMDIMMAAQLQSRIAELKRDCTLRFLKYGYQGSVLESRVEELLERRPHLPEDDGSWEGSAQDTHIHRVIGAWHEDAWGQLANATKGLPSSEKSSKESTR